jgi:hypothetical protein
MKARIINGYQFGGLYDEDFLTLNAVITAEWEMTDVLPGPERMFRPEWDGEQWFEAATEQEILEYLQPDVDALKREYDILLDDLSRKPMRLFIMEGIPIPAEITAEYARLKAECNTLIQEIIPTESYSRPASTPKGK